MDLRASSGHALDFGDLDLTGETPYGGARFYANAEGATLGNPQPVERSIGSSLLDGSFVVTDKHENREPSFQIWIEATDAAQLAYGEKLLFQQCARQIEFGWTPPDGWGPKTVYHAFTSSLTHEFDDMLEMRLIRSYRLRLVCYPFGFSELEVIDVAVDSVTPSTPVVISDGTSTTGWSVTPGPASPTINSSGGVLVVTNRQSSGSPAEFGYTRGVFEFAATKTFTATDFSATEYVTADVEVRDGGPVFSAAVNGVALQQVAMTLLSNTGGNYLYRMTWRCRATAATTLTLSALGYTLTPPGGVPATPTFRIDNVQRSNQVPAGGNSSGRQALRTLEITGSARTPGSAAIEHATSGLGDVIFYTSPELGVGYSPDLSRWADTATFTSVTNEANNVSGKSFLIGMDANGTFDVPAGALPDGPHLLLVKAVVPPEVSSITWTTSTVIGGAVMGTETGVIDTTVDLTDIFEIGVPTLPSVQVPAESTGVVRVTLRPTGSTITVDELWAFHLGEDSAITQVACGAGAPALGTVHNRLFVDSATIANDGREGLFVGTQADRSDAFHAGHFAESWETHRFAPPMIQAFVVTTGAVRPSLTLRHTPAWFTHAGR